MSSMTRKPAGVFSQKNLPSVVTLRDRAGDSVKIWEREDRDRVNKWGPPLLSFVGALASALDRFKTTLELKKAQERAAIEPAFPVMGLGIGSGLSGIALSLSKTGSIG